MGGDVPIEAVSNNDTCADKLESRLGPYLDIEAAKSGKWLPHKGMQDPLLLGESLLSFLEEGKDYAKWAREYDNFPWLKGLCLELCTMMQKRESANVDKVLGIRGQIAGTVDAQLIIVDHTRKQIWHWDKEGLKEEFDGRIARAINTCTGFKDFFENIQRFRHDLRLEPEIFDQMINLMIGDMERLYPDRLI